MANLLSEELAIVAVIDPDNRASSTTLSDAIDMSVHDRVMFIVAVGAMQLSARTYDFKVVECATSGGTYTPITGKAITQLTGADADKQVIVNVQASDLTEGYRYIKGRLYVGGVTGTGANESAVIALAGVTRFSDAVTSTSYGDLASVDEIVA